MTTNDSHRSLPSRIWNCFFVLAFGAVVIGSLYGSGAVSAGALAVIVAVVVIAFVPWSVLQLDPHGLEELGIYTRGDDDGSDKSG